MRRQARLVCESVDEVGVGLDAVDRGEPQPFEAGRGAQDGLDEAAQLQFAAEVRAV